MQTSSNNVKRALLAGVAAVATAGATLGVPRLWLVVADAVDVTRRGGPLRPDEVLTALTAAAALTILAWMALGLVLELLALVPGTVGRWSRRLADLVTPALVRRLVGGALGVGVVAGLAPGAAVAGAPPPAEAVASGVPSPGAAIGDRSHPPPLPDPGFAPTTGKDEGATPRRWGPPERGWVPDAPVVRVQPDVRVLTPSARPDPRHEGPRELVVHRGDTLWSLAARHLGPGAGDAEIADAWPKWFAANRAVIGDDPDVLHPGQRLRPPDEVRS